MVFTYLYDFTQIFFPRHLFFVLCFNTFKYCLYVSFSISTLRYQMTLLAIHSSLSLSLSHLACFSCFTFALFIFNNSFIRILLTKKEFQIYIMLFICMHTYTIHTHYALEEKTVQTNCFNAWCAVCVCVCLPPLHALYVPHCMVFCFLLSSCKLKC